MTTAKLLLHCPDKPGILAEVTDFITVNKGNIIYLDQYVDHVENIFFMRIEWELKDFLVPQEKIEDYFRTLYGQKYEMDFRLYFSDVKPRMAIFVSKLSHCLFDMLARYTAGEWNVEIPLIISNHPDLQHVAERFGIPFYLFPITKETKEEQERKEMELLAKHKITFIVLARYMQVISEQMINAYPNKIINIHHSFLPAFVISLKEICYKQDRCYFQKLRRLYLHARYSYPSLSVRNSVALEDNQYHKYNAESEKHHCRIKTVAVVKILIFADHFERPCPHTIIYA